jgi:vitamin B12 transporter
MRIWLSLSIIVFASAITFGQNAPTVRVLVEDESGPAADAVVTLVNTANNARQQAVTGTDGIALFNVSPGIYRVDASRQVNGRAFISRPFELTATPGETAVATLRLEAADTIRETVSISADLSQPLEEVSKTVNVIDGREMRERADFSLVESLRPIPGFRIQQLGGFGKTASIKTRGLRNQDTAILLDGVRLRDASAITGDASPFLSDITLTSVSRVEVLRGSGSSLYGTNSIGGTVNFITPTPRPGTHGQLSYAVGQLGLQRFRGNLSDGADDGRFGFNIAIARTAYTKGIDGNDNAHNTNFQSRVHFQPTSRTNLSARFLVSDAFVRLNSNPDTFGDLPGSPSTIIDARPSENFTFDADDPDDTQKTQLFNGQVALVQTLRPGLDLNAHYSGLRSSRKNDAGPLGVGFQAASLSRFDGTIHTANANLAWTRSPVGMLKIGYEWEHENFANNGSAPDGIGNFFTRASQSSNTLFIQDLVTFIEGRLQLAGGIRAQWFTLGSPEFSLENAPYSDAAAAASPPAAYTADGAVSYFFASTGTKIRAHVGNGYRIPSLYERYGTFFSTFITPEFIALGDPGLKPERSVAADGGVEQYLFDGRARLTATYFYTSLTETIGFGNVVPDIGNTPRPFGGYLNQRGGIARGGEFSASLKPDDATDLFASFTYTNSDQRSPQVAGSGLISTLGIPERQMTLVATRRFGRSWVNLDVLLSSSYLAPIFSTSTFSTYIYRFEGNRRADLTGGHTFRLNERFDLRLFATVENLLDHEYYENGFRTPGRNGRVGLSFGF